MELLFAVLSRSMVSADDPTEVVSILLRRFRARVAEELRAVSDEVVHGHGHVMGKMAEARRAVAQAGK